MAINYELERHIQHAIKTDNHAGVQALENVRGIVNGFVRAGIIEELPTPIPIHATDYRSKLTDDFPNDSIAYGAFLKRERQERKLSQIELGRLTGLSQAAISNIEKGVNSTISEGAFKIAQALGVNTSWNPLEQTVLWENL